MTITIIPIRRPRPHGKLADVELRFARSVETDAPLFDAHPALLNAEAVLDGLTLVGFAVWAGHGDRPRYVTVPSRHYENEQGQRTRVPLLRPSRAHNVAGGAALQSLQDEILKAYDLHERAVQGAEVVQFLQARVADGTDHTGLGGSRPRVSR